MMSEIKLMLKANLDVVPNFTDLKENYLIRNCRFSDIDELGKLYFHSYELGAACESEQKAIIDIENSFKGVYGPFWFETSKVIEHKKEIVGAVLVVHKNSWDDSIICPYIIELFVKKEFRQKGFARKLIIDSCNEMRKSNQNEVALTVVASNISARNLYKVLGFIESTSQ